jgi:hypothetical protein
MASRILATVVAGHRVASGLNGNPRFPGGTIRMQAPHFLAQGVDLSPFHAATLNVSISPHRFRIVKPRCTIRSLKWHPVEPAEDFSFFDAKVRVEPAEPIAGLIYFPHPDTKPEHFQKPDMLELLLPWIDGLDYGMKVMLEVPCEQMVFER